MGNFSPLLSTGQVPGLEHRQGLPQRCEVKRLTSGRRSVAWEEVELPQHRSPFL